jgi:hypothetical protein
LINNTKLMKKIDVTKLDFQPKSLVFLLSWVGVEAILSPRVSRTK